MATAILPAGHELAFDGWWGLIISFGGGLISAVGLLAVFYRPTTTAD